MKRLLGVLFLAVAFIAAAFALGSFWLYLICKGLGGCSEASYAYFIFTGLLNQLTDHAHRSQAPSLHQAVSTDLSLPPPQGWFLFLLQKLYCQNANQYRQNCLVVSV